MAHRGHSLLLNVKDSFDISSHKITAITHSMLCVQPPDDANDLYLQHLRSIGLHMDASVIQCNIFNYFWHSQTFVEVVQEHGSHNLIFYNGQRQLKFLKLSTPSAQPVILQMIESIHGQLYVNSDC